MLLRVLRRSLSSPAPSKRDRCQTPAAAAFDSAAAQQVCDRRVRSSLPHPRLKHRHTDTNTHTPAAAAATAPHAVPGCWPFSPKPSAIASACPVDVRDQAQSLLDLGVISQHEFVEVVVADSAYRSVAMSSGKCSSKRRLPHPPCDVSEDHSDPRDPITLEPLTQHRFVFREGQVAVEYNADSLCAYLLATGHFVEPTTRLPLTSTHVCGLCTALEAMGTPKAKDEARQLRDAFSHPHDRFRRGLERVHLIEGLERCTGEAVTAMLALIENTHTNSTHKDEEEEGEDYDEDEEEEEDGEVRLCLLFGQFEHHWGQLVQQDTQAAATAIDQYMALLRGPPNRPTKDRSGCGLLQACLSYLGDKEAALCPHKHKKKANKHSHSGSSSTRGEQCRSLWSALSPPPPTTTRK